MRGVLSCMARCLRPSALAMTAALAALAGQASPHPPGQASPDPPGQGLLPFAAVGPDQGFPAVGPEAMVQDRDGFLWLATGVGAMRCEGGRTRLWGLQEGLPGGAVVRLLADPQGGVWVGTRGGLARIRHGRVEPVDFGPGAPNRSVAHPVLDGAGRVWAATRAGLFVQRDGLRFEARPTGLAGDLFQIAPGRRSGRVYLAASGRIQVFTPEGGSRLWGPEKGLRLGSGLLMMAEDGDGRFWVGQDRTLLVLEPGAERFQDRSRLLGARLAPGGAPYVDPDGCLWLPVAGGLLNLRGDRVERLGVAEGLPFATVRTAFRDQEGTLWVLGPSLARLLGGGRLRLHPLAGAGAPVSVWRSARMRDGALLVGSDDGAFRVGDSGRTRIPGTEGRRINGLATDSEGTVWMASATGPTLWLRAGSTRALPAPLGEAGTLALAVHLDRRGQIRLGSGRQGVLRWDPARRRLVPEVGAADLGLAAPASLAVLDLQEDAQGRLWGASSAGLLLGEGGRWRLFDARHGLDPGTVLGVLPLPDGSVWLHHLDPRGLTRVALAGDGLTVLERRRQGTGLCSDKVHALARTADGGIWLSTDQGVQRLDPFLRLGRDDGLPTEDCSMLSLRAEADRLWLGTAGGLVSLALPAPGTPPAGPPASILEADLGGRRITPPADDPGGPLAHGASTVVFRLAAPAYAHARRVRFQVRMVGLEEAWTTLDSPVARYPGLASGRYRFEARAAFEEGPPGAATAFTLEVRPPWWRTWWSGALFLATLAGAVQAGIHLRVAALARARARLEAVVAEQTQELRDRNQALTEALANVKQLSGLLPICAQCKKIRDDNGYWNQLEAYLAKHANADFSHGICPGCAELLFPEVMARRRAAEARDT